MSECVDHTAMAELVAEAKRKAHRCDVDMETHAKALQSPGAMQAAAKELIDNHAVKRIVGGWHVILSLDIYEDGLHHWHGSAMLWPEGRCSTDQDWKNLGLIVALTGAPESVDEQLEAQMRGVDPNRPHHWIWFEPAKAEA